ncbi:MAG: peptidase [Burkholderiales bacterium]|nr:peptidase [Burkholderiales bacterium]
MRAAIAAVSMVVAAVMLAACAGPRMAAPVFDRKPPRAVASPARPPAPAVAAQAAPQPAPDGFYVVKRGDTLYSIALDHGADYREVAQWNGLDDATKINVGQLLRVQPPQDRRTEVGAARVPGPIESRPIDAVPQAQAQGQGQGDGAARTEPKAVRLPYSKENAALVSREGAAEAKGDARADTGGFVWPAKGKVIAGFSEPRSKGIDIDGKAGDPVVAAAAGRVTYIGTGIPGLGKLVVIKHDNGFITVYAHNREILVKEHQAVARGEKIAELGATDADRPKLHFQIRKGSAPVDPMRYLPGL